MAANSKNALAPHQIITSGDMSGDVTSDPTNIQFLDNISIQLNFTGTPTGTFSVQGSLDYQQTSPFAKAATGNWIDLTLSPSPAASGSASQILLDLNQLSFPWIRVKYTRSSGSGTLNAFISGKAV